MADHIIWTGENMDDVLSFVQDPTMLRHNNVEGLLVFNNPRWLRVHPGQGIAPTEDGYFKVVDLAAA